MIWDAIMVIMTSVQCIASFFNIEIAQLKSALDEHEEHMMTSSNGNISALLVFCKGNHRPPVDSTHNGQWHGALAFSLMCAWADG